MHRAETSSSDSLLFSRGIVEHPLEDPLADWTPVQEEVSPDLGNPPLVSGWAYSDGSAKGPPGLKSFGWVFAFLDQEGAAVKAMRGSLPGLRCLASVLRAELYGLLKLLESARPPLRVGIDNSTEIRGLRRGPKVALLGSAASLRPLGPYWGFAPGLLP